MARNARKTRQKPYIREWLRHLGIRQKEVAERVGMSEAELSRKLNAIRGIDMDWLYRIAEVIAVRPEQLLRPPPDEGDLMGIFYELNDAELRDVAAYARFRLSGREGG